jgi:phosphatidylglycerophosphate synthase
MTMEKQGQNVGDRRPIATRELALSKRAASWLAARGVSANAISVAGMVAGAAAGAAFSLTAAWPDLARLWWLSAAACIQARLLANMFDGMVAIETQTASAVGELYNEVPDRISDTATLIGLGYAAGGIPVLGYVAALAAVFTAYVRAVAKVAGAPQDFCGPMAKQQRMFVATIVAVYAGVAPQAWHGPWPAESRWALPAWALALITGGSLATALRRLLRAAAALPKVRP